MTPQIEISRQGEFLIIKLPINPTPPPSATGKTLVVASTHGNVPSTVTIDGKPVIVGVNAYIRR